MLQFIKKLFGFGKKETVAVDITKVFTSPIKEAGEKALSEVMASYKEEVKFDETDGTVTINGTPHIEYKKEYWLGQNGDTPNIETITVPVSGISKEDSEKILQERISEIEAKKTDVSAPVKAKVEKKSTPKPKTTQKAAPKKPETKVEAKETSKAKPAPKKATKKAEK